MDSFVNISMELLKGFCENLKLFSLTLLFSVPAGLLVMFCSISKFKPLKWLSKTFVWIIRGTPLMLQLFVVLYVPGLLFNTPIKVRFTAALIAFVINYACYFSEIYRGGIESISKGQYEAGQVLGMTKPQIFFKVILLQVVKRIVPPNEQRSNNPCKRYFLGKGNSRCGNNNGCRQVFGTRNNLAAVLYRRVFLDI